MSKKKNKAYVCPKCGSQVVLFDALSKWNPEKQLFELFQTFDDATCGDCEYEAEGFRFKKE